MGYPSAVPGRMRNPSYARIRQRMILARAGASMDDAIQVLTTTGDQQTAALIAEHLVENRLAACVQVGGPITSVYRWRGQVETATEWTCTIKTVRSLYSAVESCIRQLHSYEEPEIVVVDLTDGSPTYLAWLRAQVTAVNP